MLETVSNYLTKGKWIDFRLHGISPSGKTKTWVVQNRENSTVLGRIEWFSRWRKYTFQPYPDMVFEETCLADISEFIQQETKAQMQRAADARKAAKA